MVLLYDDGMGLPTMVGMKPEGEAMARHGTAFPGPFTWEAASRTCFTAFVFCRMPKFLRIDPSTRVVRPHEEDPYKNRPLVCVYVPPSFPRHDFNAL